MAIFYVLPATGFNIALSPDVVAEMDPENVVEVLTTLFTTVGFSAMTVKYIVIIAGLMFIYTFVANIASWSFGVNEVAKYAAEDGSMPKMFMKTNEDGVPYKASIINGVVASIIVVGGVLANLINEDFAASFSLFFCLSWITLLLGYVPMFLAFLKLRKTDKDIKRPYKVPGGEFVIRLVAWVPFVILILGIIFTLFGDFTSEFIMDSIPLYAGVILSFICEEILVWNIKNKKEGK